MGLLSLGGRLISAGGKNWQRTGQIIDNVGSVAVIGSLAAQVPGLNKAWTQEAIDGKELEDYAKDPDTGKRDLSSVRDDLGWKNWIPGLRPTDDQIKSALEKKEQGQIAEQRRAILSVNPELAPYLGGRVSGETSEDFDVRSAGAFDRYKDDKFKRKLDQKQTETLATYYSKPAVEERRLAAEMRNDTLLREAQIRADAINARQDSNLLTLQLAEMNDRADHRREKAGARQALVAALVGSLDNLGNAFVSI